MDKFEFGNYESATVQNIVFDSNKGYEEVAGETEARKQLSNPLNELKDYINKMLPTFQSDPNTVLKVGVNSTTGMIGYQQIENGTWTDVASQGHFIEKENDGVVERLPQTSTLRFVDVEINNVDGATIIQGYQGPQGPEGPTGPAGPQGPEGPSGRTFEILGRFDTLEELEQLTGERGDAYAVGTSTQNPIYVWNATINDWQDIGILTGAQGEQGPAGPKGDTGATGPGVASGGTTGQYLVKSNNTDYATQWVTLTMPTVDTTYSGTSNNAQSGKAVKQAIDALDGTITGTAGAGKTLSALSQTDGKISATFVDAKPTWANIQSRPTSFTPASHTHGSITNAGAITDDTAIANGDHLVFTDSDGSNKLKRSSITFGTSTSKFLRNDGTWENSFPTIDPTRVLTPSPIYTSPYEATEDCFVLPTSRRGGVKVGMQSGTTVLNIGHFETASMTMIIPLKKGDKIGQYEGGSLTSGDGFNFYVYGIK